MKENKYDSLLQAGFEIFELIEPQPNEVMLNTIPEMKDELRRPMMLLISAKKKYWNANEWISGYWKIISKKHPFSYCQLKNTPYLCTAFEKNNPSESSVV